MIEAMKFVVPHRILVSRSERGHEQNINEIGPAAKEK
jgi:hypothetical protein